MQYIMYKGIMMPVEKAVQMKLNGTVNLTDDIKAEEIEVEEEVEVKTDETPVLTVEEMKLKLDEAGVSYHHAAGLPKLTELMEENNLL